MIRCRSKLLALGCAFIAVLVMAQPVAAQNYWMRPGEGTSVSLEIFKPKFDHSDGYKMLTSVWLFSAQIEANERLSIIADLPISNVDWESDYYYDYYSYPREAKSTLIANPYLGIEYKLANPSKDETSLVRVGVRLPLADEDEFGASYIGIFTLPDRAEVFVPDLAVLSGGIGWRRTLGESGIRLELDINGTYWIPTDGGETELLGDYSFAFRLPIQVANLGLGLAGRMLITESDLDMAERTEHYARLSANFDAGRIRPGVHILVPIEEDVADFVDYSYGVNFTYLIK